MVVGERAGAGSADTLDRFPRAEAEAAQDEAGDQPAPVHAMRAHDEEVLGREAAGHRGDCLRYGGVDSELGGEGAIEVGEDERKKTRHGGAQCVIEVASAIDNPGASDSGRVERLAGEAVGSAHPDGGAAAMEFTGGEDEAGACNGVMVQLEIGRLKHVFVRWYGMPRSASLEDARPQELAHL